MKIVLSLVGLLIAGSVQSSSAAEPLRIIGFGAHPDDAEFQMAGTAIKFAKAGHKVKLVSVTNGDIGHWREAGGPLAMRRTREVQEAARRMGIEVEVLDIHDGELVPSLDNRKKIIRLIREWQADIVLAHRPWDYHPDHRYTGMLVQDAAFMVAVPFICPDTPPLTKNAAFFYFPDNFQKPYPFTPDVVISIDDVFEDKLHAIDALESQVYEGGALASPAVLIKRKAADPEQRKEILRLSWSARQGRIADKYRDGLIGWYGEAAGSAVKHAEAFEICEYGRKPSKSELKALFPFFDK